jgi:hypothetical protein
MRALNPEGQPKGASAGSTVSCYPASKKNGSKAASAFAGKKHDHVSRRKRRWVDLDDAPPRDRHFFERAAICHGDKLIPARPPTQGEPETTHFAALRSRSAERIPRLPQGPADPRGRRAEEPSTAHKKSHSPKDRWALPGGCHPDA